MGNVSAWGFELLIIMWLWLKAPFTALL